MESYLQVTSVIFSWYCIYAYIKSKYILCCDSWPEWFLSRVEYCLYYLLWKLKGKISALLILSDVKQAHSRKLLSTVLYGISNDMISRSLLIFGAWGMEQKVLTFEFWPYNRCSWWTGHESPWRLISPTNWKLRTWDFHKHGNWLWNCRIKF